MGKARVARLRSFGLYENLRVELEIEAERGLTDDEVLALAARVEKLSKQAVAQAQGYSGTVESFSDKPVPWVNTEEG